jgi:multidrug efflux pump
LLFMQDVIGRLFREFAITVSVTILISAFVSLTLTPMLCSRMLRHHKPDDESKFQKEAETFQKKVILKYAETLRWVLNHQRLILILALVNLLITLLLFYFIPKGFFPVQDTGVIQGISDMAQTTSFAAMTDRQQALAKVVLKDPAVDSLSSFIGIDGTNVTLNSGRMLINLKPLNERSENASAIIRRLQPELNKVVGATLYMQPVQDLTIDDRVSRTQYQFTVGSSDVNEVARWTGVLVKKLQQLPELRDVTSDLQNVGLQTVITIDRDTASRLGITAETIDNTLYDAFGQRQVSTMFTQRNQYHVILETLEKLQQGPTALDNIYLNSAAGVAIPLSAFTHVSLSTAPLVVNRQGQFPVSTVSFNLAPKASLGQAIREINQVTKDLKIR